MKKLLIFISILLFLMGCSNNENEGQLTRVDVFEVTEGGDYEDEMIIANQDSIEVLWQVFDQIEWEQNVKAEMSRIEDIKTVLFMEVDENMPERLVEYYIWFEGNGTSTFIDRDTNSLGKLNEEGTDILKSEFEKK